MIERGHETIDHTADMGIRGWGATPAEAFEETARAMFGLVADIDGIQPSIAVPLRRRARDLTELLLEFLNALIADADVREVVFCGVFVERLAERRGGWVVEATARGAPLAAVRGRLLVEVKAATFYGASVRREESGRWVAQCVVDL